MAVTGGGIPLPQSWTIEVPTSLQLKNGKVYLNLNWYRNANFHILNKAKITFAELVSKKLTHLPKFEMVHLDYEIFAGTAREFDVANVGSIVDKFFSDTLVGVCKLEDDNYNVVLSARYRFGGISKGNPHCLVHIQPVLSVPTVSGETMQITLVQHEIETALRNYVTSLLNVREGHRIDITLKATRGEDGSTAVIDIVKDDQQDVQQAVLARPVVRAVGLRPAAVVSEDTAKATSSTEVPAAAVVGSDVVEDGIGTDDAVGQAAEPRAEAQEAGTTAETPTPRPAGLFAGLKKPGVQTAEA